MALIQITADLSRVAKALEKIADLLDELLHPAVEQIEPSTEEDVGTYVAVEAKDGRTIWNAYNPRRDY